MTHHRLFIKCAIAFGVVLLEIACKGAEPATHVDADGSVDGIDGPSGESFATPADAPDPQSTDADATMAPVVDAEPGVGLDATDLDGAGPDAEPMACGFDASGDAASCTLPRSDCADRRWLVFYDDGQCVSGQCVWQKRYVDCGTIGCFFGACDLPPTH